MEFGTKLKQFRMRKQWTLEKTSGVTGVTTAALSKIENGKVQPHDLTKAKIRTACPEFDEFEEQTSEVA